jgi:acyl carrier protein
LDEPEICARLAEIFKDIFDEDSINVTPDLSAVDVDGWDSLTHIRLILTIEKEFKIKFSTTEIGKMKNVGDLVALIKSNKGIISALRTCSESQKLRDSPYVCKSGW